MSAHVKTHRAVLGCLLAAFLGFAATASSVAPRDGERGSRDQASAAMVGTGSTVTSTALLSASARAVPEDPLGLDPGPDRDEEVFLALVQTGRQRHPLLYLQYVAQGGSKDGMRTLRAFFRKQAGLKGRAAEVTELLAENLIRLGNELIDADNHPALYRAKYEKRLRTVVTLGSEFFRIVPRHQRVRIYKIAEKIANPQAVYRKMRKGRSPEDGARLEADIKLTVQVLDWLHGRRPQGAEQAGVSYGDELLKRTGPFDF